MARFRSPLVALVMVGFGVAAAASACSTGTTGTSGASSSSSSTGGGGTSNAGGSSGGGSGGNSSAAGSSSRANSSSRAATSGFSFGSSGFMIPDGGFNVDAGFQPYNGTPEPGVVCGTGGAICDQATDGGLCCVGVFSGQTVCAAMCQQLDLSLRCDGPEDCTGGNVCCVAVQGITAVNECRPAAMCEGNGSLQQPLRICNTSADCPAGSGCCESATLRGLLPALMVGACVQGCNVQ